MRTVCFTVDADRDANIPSKTGKALSARDGIGAEPRFVSSEKGMRMLTEIFDDAGIDATFFAEARTLEQTGPSIISGYEAAVHGLDHEDLSGNDRGVPMSADEIRNVLDNAKGIIRDLTGKDPKGFRAPYMRCDDRMYGALEDLGFEYSSSKYAEVFSAFPYKIGKITEFPVPKGIDSGGKRIAAYLWQMHEGKRPYDDYVELAGQAEGTFVLATHSWHMTEYADGTLMDADEIKKNGENVKKIIETLLDDGFRFSAMGSLI